MTTRNSELHIHYRFMLVCSIALMIVFLWLRDQTTEMHMTIVLSIQSTMYGYATNPAVMHKGGIEFAPSKEGLSQAAYIRKLNKWYSDTEVGLLQLADSGAPTYELLRIEKERGIIIDNMTNIEGLIMREKVYLLLSVLAACMGTVVCVMWYMQFRGKGIVWRSPKK